MTQEEIEDWICKFKTPHREKPGPDDLTGEFYQMFKRRINTNSLPTQKKTEMERTLSSPFYEVSIILTPKPDKDVTRKLWTDTYYEYRHKNSPQNTSSWIQKHIKMITHHDRVRFVSDLQDSFNI